MDIITRSRYIDEISPFINKPVIKVLTGMRRVGKSFILKMIIDNLKDAGVNQEDIIYINKESLQWETIDDYASLYRYVLDKYNNRNGALYLFVDEIQEIKYWEKAVNSILTENLADIFITGSNARLLSSEIATNISGRYVEFKIYPLTFKEFLDFRKSKKGDSSIYDEFKLFLKYGGLPGIHLFDLEEDVVFQYHNSILNTILFKDVVQKNALTDPQNLEKILMYIFDNCGNITTAKRVSDFLKNQKISVSIDKVLNYLSYLQSGFLIYKTMRYDLKGLRILELYEKFYMGDIGLRNGFIGYKDKDIGGILENVVYLELLTRGFKVYIGKYENKEIDFIAENKKGKIYIQVCYALSSDETIEREFSVLESVGDNYPKYVLSTDAYQSINRNGIIHKNIIEFLTENAQTTVG